MATKQNKKALRASAPHVHTKHLRYSRKAGLLLLVLLVVLIGFMTYSHKRAVDKTAAIQQAQFDKVDAQMKTVMAQIEATAGKPYELHYGHGCSHTALKFKEGPLSCGIYYNFFYPANSIPEGIKLTQAILLPIKNSQINEALIIPNDIAQLNDFLEYSYSISTVNFGCAITYRLSPSINHNNVIGAEFNKTVDSRYASEYNYACSGPASRPYYKLHRY